MRHVVRPDIPHRSKKWLGKQTTKLASEPTLDPKKLWRERRNTMNRNGISQGLRDMAGWRARCMYCGDSEGCDIEHFRPKSRPEWRAFVFVWENFLWICQPCNRLKSATFPVDVASAPLLLDPSADRPWDYFDFVPVTGYLVARADLLGSALARAEATLLEINTRLGHQIILSERQRSFRHLVRAAEAYLSCDVASDGEKEFINACVDSGYPELCEWFYARTGSVDHPFSAVIGSAPAVVAKLKQALNELYPSVWL